MKKEKEQLITALVKYDLFPYCLTFKGILLPDGSVRVRGIGIYTEKNIIKILPESEYEKQNDLVLKLAQDYRQKKIEIEENLLKDAGMDYLCKNK